MSELIWHDVECGGYTADLPLWEELADACPADGAILELGCGAGRVATHLAPRHEQLVIGLEQELDLIEALWERAEGITADAEHEDVRNFGPLGTEFDLVLAPMQLFQLLGGNRQRLACLSCMIDHMTLGARAALAIVEEPPTAPEDALPPLPDVRQIEGSIYSSLPLESQLRDDKLVLRRLRQVVDPAGALTEEVNEVELGLVSAETIEQEARAIGFTTLDRRQIPATDAHVGSTVVVLAREV
jgi:SAM-dependent methyltransferase